MVWFTDFVSLIFPIHCITCGGHLNTSEEIMCLACHDDLPITNYFIQLDNPVFRIFTGRVKIRHGAAFLHFEKGGKTQKLMHALKYKGRPEVGIYLGHLMALKLKESTSFSLPDLIIPVPLHPSKQRLRGYNQSERIAQGLAVELEVPVSTTLLRRLSKSTSQTKKKRYERWENVHNVFEFTSPENLDATHILLIDDVITTGATMEACINAVRLNSKAEISVLTLAFSN